MLRDEGLAMVMWEDSCCICKFVEGVDVTDLL